jgi:glycosyltransferase involved in cell wall biosynthesis
MSPAPRTSSARSRIFYLAPDYQRPSWGVALLYEHVRLLRELGHDARLLHHRAPFRLDWLELEGAEVPIDYLDALGEAPTQRDLLVVPEVLAADAARLPFAWRRGVFVQGSFLIVSGLDGAASYPELGYSFALAVLPHVASIVERHFGVAAALVPPLIAPYFFQEPERIRLAPRLPVILFVMKPEYRDVGFPDYAVFDRLVRRRFETAEAAGGWRVIGLGGMSHREVARRMAEASFLVNLNSHEAFNTTVPEAMASGCIPICYDAFGGRDFLVDGENAFVFPNHHIFPLIEKTLALTVESGLAGASAGTLPARGAPPDASSALDRMRLAARARARRYDGAATRAALDRAFTTILAAPAAR